MAKHWGDAEKLRFEALSEFRFRLRSFLRFSENAAREEGITALQYQLLLSVSLQCVTSDLSNGTDGPFNVSLPAGGSRLIPPASLLGGAP